MKKDHLIIVAPRGGSFDDYLCHFPALYSKRSQSLTTVYFSYIGEQSPLLQACQILSVSNFKEFSLVKEGSYYRLKVHVE